MSAPSTSIVSVHTEDADPDAAAYRISAVPGHDVATAVVSIDTGTSPGVTPYVAAVRLVTGAARNLGVIANLGAVCGLSRCGGPGVMPLRIEDSPVEMTFEIPEAKIAGADRDVTVTLWTLVEPAGWV